MVATAERTRARIGWRRPWGGAWISWSVPESLFSKEVLIAWAKEGVALDWQKLLPPEGFQVLPRRWVVERTFLWIDQNRRIIKDYERLPETAEAFIYVAMSRLMARRLARS
jgi:transposase